MERLILAETEALAEFCRLCASESYISIDTEFVREHTYYPKLCLVQIGTQEKSALIDPLAEGIVLEPLFDLLRNPSVLKVFHAARQDLEIFYYLMGDVVYPVYDTQIAAMALGNNEQIAYHGLVTEYLGLELDKGSRMTQWDLRPLSVAQCDYAFMDVEPLHQLYPMQCQQLLGREEWIEEVHSQLVEVGNLSVEPENAWRLLKLRQLKPRYLGCVAAIAEWREFTARRLDLPRRWVLSDESVITLAQNQPKSVEDCNKLRIKPKKIPNIAQLLDIIQQAKPLTLSKAEKRPLPKEDLLQMLRLALHRCAREHGFAPRLLCSADQLQDLSGLDPDSPAWQQHPLQQGWRRQIFGEMAERMACGRVVLRYSGDQLDFVPIAQINS